jgi:hypothetical protein
VSVLPHSSVYMLTCCCTAASSCTKQQHKHNALCTECVYCRGGEVLDLLMCLQSVTGTLTVHHQQYMDW